MMCIYLSTGTLPHWLNESVLSVYFSTSPLNKFVLQKSNKIVYSQTNPFYSGIPLFTYFLEQTDKHWRTPPRDGMLVHTVAVGKVVIIPFYKTIHILFVIYIISKENVLRVFILGG